MCFSFSCFSTALLKRLEHIWNRVIYLKHHSIQLRMLGVEHIWNWAINWNNPRHSYGCLEWNNSALVQAISVIEMASSIWCGRLLENPASYWRSIPRTMTTTEPPRIHLHVWRAVQIFPPRHAGDHLGQKYLLRKEIDFWGTDISNYHYYHVHILKLTKQSNGKRNSCSNSCEQLPIQKECGKGGRRK